MWTNIFIIGVLIIIGCRSHSTIPYYLCEEPLAGGFYVKPPVLENCNQSNAENHITIDASVFVPIGAAFTVDGARCESSVRIVCKTSSFGILPDLINDTTVNTIVSQEDCERAWSTKLAPSGKLLADYGNGVYKLETLDSSYYPWFEEKCFEMPRFIMITTKVSTVDGKIAFTEIGSLDNSTFYDEMCSNTIDGSMTIWRNASSFNDYCPFTLRGIYSIDVIDNLVVIKGLKSAIQFATKRGAIYPRIPACLSSNNSVYFLDGDIGIIPKTTEDDRKMNAYRRMNRINYNASINRTRILDFDQSHNELNDRLQYCKGGT